MTIILDLSNCSRADFFPLTDQEKEKRVIGSDAANILQEKSNLKNLVSCPEEQSFYWWSESDGIYFSVSLPELGSILSRGLIKLDPKLTQTAFIKELILCLQSVLVNPLLNIESSLDYIAFQNGVLNLKTKSFSSFNKNFFVLNKLPFNYSSASPNMPIFFSFLKNFSGSSREKAAFCRAFLYCALVGRPDLQTFFYFFGPARTGKSTFITLMSALVGLDYLTSTSFDHLEMHPFEILPLVKKKIILIPDSPPYFKKLSVLKQLTGQDFLRGRRMHSSVIKPVQFRGTLVATGNQLLTVDDSTGAIQRRLRAYHANTVIDSKDVTSLISFDPTTKTFFGPLAEELPFIFYWAFNCPAYFIETYIQNYEKELAFRVEQEIILSSTNSVGVWISEELSPLEKNILPIGSKPFNKKEAMEKKTETCYCAYIHYCKKMGVKPQSLLDFTENLLGILQKKGFSVKRQKINNLPVLVGFKLSPKNFDLDLSQENLSETNEYSSPLDKIPFQEWLLTDTPELLISQAKVNNVKIQTKNKVNSSKKQVKTTKE